MPGILILKQVISYSALISSYMQYRYYITEFKDQRKVNKSCMEKIYLSRGFSSPQCTEAKGIYIQYNILYSCEYPNN